MKQVALVASDVLGVITNSGIATATTHLALVLAHQGHQVTIVNTGHAQRLDDTWRDRYRAAGISVEHLDRQTPVSPDYLQESFLIYRYLRDREFDSLVLQDWLGPAFACVRAKRSGLAFDSTQLIVVTHGPTEWVREANRELRITQRELAVAHMERVAIEGADLLVGPSAYLLDWMTANGWRIGRTRSPVPHFTAGHVADLTGISDFRRGRTAPESTEPVRELVFFGRLEHRKGIQPYTRALNLIDPQLLSGVTLSFMGREATYTRGDVAELLHPRVRGAVDGILFHTDFDQEKARTYLHQQGRVAIMPSLDENSPNTIYECVEDRIPFLAAKAGGIPELIDQRDHERCLFENTPDALARSLTDLLSTPEELPIARPAFDAQASLRIWDEILESEALCTERPTERPLVSVVVPHHDQPELVALTLDSLQQQDYPSLEVILVDDGSETPEAQAALKRFEERSWRHPVTVVRQPNAYLGAARNTGVRHARGDLLIFIDDDDLAAPHYVSAMTTAIQMTGAAAVSCAFSMFDEQEGQPESAVLTWVFLGNNLPLTVMGNHAGGAGIILRREAWEAIGGYHEIHGLGLEDWDLLVRLLMAGRDVVSIPEPAYWYRLRPTSMRITMDRYRSHEIILERFRDVMPDGLRDLPDIIHGLALAMEDDGGRSALRHEFDRRERYQWLLERRIELLEAELHARGWSATDC